MQEFWRCLCDKRNTSNDFFKEKKKYHQIAQFINKHPRFAAKAFDEEDKPFDKGYRLGRFFRSFFEYYYQYVLHPAETISTRLLRAITTKVVLFEHEDISPCVALETSGKISENLENLDIKNIYINIPEAFNAFRFMKLKQKCRNDKYLGMVGELGKRLAGIDMFRVMYNDYTTYVELAAERDASYQIDTLARVFASMIKEPERYVQLSQEEM